MSCRVSLIFSRANYPRVNTVVFCGELKKANLVTLDNIHGLATCFDNIIKMVSSTCLIFIQLLDDILRLNLERLNLKLSQGQRHKVSKCKPNINKNANYFTQNYPISLFTYVCVVIVSHIVIKKC